jgi:hypothetical protein
MAPEGQSIRARDAAPDLVEATINYIGAMTERPKFHAQDHGRDNLRYEPRRVAITNARALRDPPTLEQEGLTIASHRSGIRDFRDAADVREKYPRELERLIVELTGAVRAKMLGGGLVRYTERSPHYRTGMNTQPARFPHVDFTPNTSPGLSENVFGAKPEKLEPGQRLVGYNIWRVVSEPPQDVPLAVVDSRTVARADLLPADGVYDQGDDRSKWWELEAYVLRHNPAHRWLYYRDMRPDEVLIFRGYGNEPTWRAGVPHSAFDDSSCPPGAPPRVSIEARVYAIYD